MQPSPQKIVILAGPTAVGKTATLQKIQQCIGGNSDIEVISCDSIQVYKHLDIGSAKPSLQTRAALPHHLLDALQPQEKFSAGYFVRQCDKIIPQIIDRGNIPIIAGGTIFYLKNFLYGPADIPATLGRWRQKLEQMTPKQLGKQLQVLDAASWQRIHPNDKQRLVRACEVCLESGRPFSSYEVDRKIRRQYSTLMLTLNLERALLYQRINLRIEKMFAQGLEQEIKLLKKMGLSGGEQSLQGIGYREFFGPNNNTNSDANEQMLDRKKLIAKIQQNSRRYAKRQLTFLRQLPNCEAYGPDDSQQIAARISQFYATEPQ